MAQKQQGNEVSGWAIGGVAFAGIMMILMGSMQVFNGLVAIAKGGEVAVVNGYALVGDATTWGWVHFGLGLLVAVAGGAVLFGRSWARMVALVVVILSAISNFINVAYYPFWSLLLIGLNVWVIWALTRFGLARE
jgi:hypothetical protein